MGLSFAMSLAELSLDQEARRAQTGLSLGTLLTNGRKFLSTRAHTCQPDPATALFRVVGHLRSPAQR